MDVHYRAADGKNSTPVSDTAPLPVKALAYDGAGNSNDATHPVFVGGGGTAGNAASQVQTVQGIAAMTPIASKIQSVVGGQFANMPTYMVVGTGYAGYATPTDLVAIFGSASKTIAVTSLSIVNQSTSATLISYYWLKRSTANSGGTPTNPAAIPYDSGDAAATAVVTAYGSAPTTGTSLGSLRVNSLLTTVLTAAPSSTAFQTNIAVASGITFTKPVILRGTGEGLCLNFNGAALPGGYAATYLVEWCEF